MAAKSNKMAAKASHVNMMTDTVITNLPLDGLRTIIRSLLASHPQITATFEQESRRYMEDTAEKYVHETTECSLDDIKRRQKTVRCMIGCGMCHQSLRLICDVAPQAAHLLEAKSENIGAPKEVYEVLAAIDGDMVQVATAVEKSLISGAPGTTDSLQEVSSLYQVLYGLQKQSKQQGTELPYKRGLIAMAGLLGEKTDLCAAPAVENLLPPAKRPSLESQETFTLAGRRLPRIFSGLWQLSSPAWGSAPASEIFKQFSLHVSGGFTAFDMADHYGDAEVLVGQFLASYPFKDDLFAATKYCVFHPMTVTRDAVRQNISERCRRLMTDRIDLLQFHWQFYDDPQYLKALQYLVEDDRVGALGLCNFDTAHMEQALAHGIKIHSNQVQFSLIDSRPTKRMGEICLEHKIKLLTYGTLCGGFLSDKWLDRPEPGLYDQSITPSQRKYHGVIRAWGDWTLFQELLKILSRIARKHSGDSGACSRKSISNVATRWVLDFPYVGAVIVGARMGISEHTADNAGSFGWALDMEDRAAIEQVLVKSRREAMFQEMGDCGGEYR